MDVIFETRTKIVGVTKGNHQALLSELSEDDEIQLIREEDNEYDPNAIAVLNSDEKKLGYINSELAEEICSEMDADPESFLTGSILEVTGGYDGKSFGCNIEVSLCSLAQEKKEIALNKAKSLKSYASIFYVMGVVAAIISIFGFSSAWPIGVFILIIAIVIFAVGAYYSKLGSAIEKFWK